MFAAYFLPTHNLFPLPVFPHFPLSFSSSCCCAFRLKKLWRMLSKSNEIKVLTQLKYPKEKKERKQGEREREKKTKTFQKTKLYASKTVGGWWVWQVPALTPGRVRSPRKRVSSPPIGRAIVHSLARSPAKGWVQVTWPAKGYSQRRETKDAPQWRSLAESYEGCSN